jgi:hypothetical protein
MFDFEPNEPMWGKYFSFQARQNIIKMLFQISAVAKLESSSGVSSCSQCQGYQRIFNDCSVFGRTKLNKINILHSKVNNSKKIFLFAALLGLESRIVSFGVSTGFRLSF